ncbi:MAG: hypothetical protein A2W90_07215 [Bacteroidetes bacterium GWF2_42_66]|nr:MAG: hypothetical protein A2W92_07200 [Bacteroidetes bacterium GWA2_42_15]OFX96883.1 MAG: hypothetical protein A2W89_19915 [Bacteroidetes bacterium GWE2_42_39]OFY44640.1 MAG: hypothetical protein A2W90_07215 [Bacteroidetes bacterium GWF2_42_66]
MNTSCIWLLKTLTIHAPKQNIRRQTAFVNASDTLYQKNVSSLLTGDAETGSGGDQPARNILSGWNGLGAQKAPTF